MHIYFSFKKKMK